jgi:DNA polymerase-3 subunit epsilon
MWHTVQRWLDRGPPTDDARWVVLDVEASGLDMRRDRLLAVAAVAVHRGTDRPVVDVGDSFEVVLRQPELPASPDKGNILLHGIGVGAQRGGVAPADALAAFAAWVGRSPLIAFHAEFDRTLLDRASRDAGRAPLAGAWLDLAPLAAVVHPEVRARALDDWLAHFGIACALRHQAAADALATADLLLRLWPALTQQVPRPDFRALRALAAARRWMPG